MTGWSLTTTFADAAVRNHVHPRFRRLASAAVRGALLLDLAAARMVLAHDGHLYASTPHSGFAPADTLLAATARETSADLAPLLWRSRVGMDDVIAELAARRWWEPVPRRPWRWRTRYRPSALLIGSVHDPGAMALTELLMMLFRSSTDTDDLELTAAHTDFGSANWLVSPVLHELVELRAWLQAAVTTHQPTA